MADQADSAAQASERTSFFGRVLSLLRGGEGAAPAPAAPASESAPAAGLGAPAVAVPPLDRLTIRQWLWGAGFIIPGDAEYVLTLVKPFAANPAMSMLDVAAGLGGPARAVAEKFGTYITGLERDAELARRGMEMSIAAGMQKRAPIVAYDPENFELRAHGFDCILGRGATASVTDKERFIRVLALGLKPRGQLLLTEYLVDPAAGNRPELAAWAALQPQRQSLWTLRQYTDCFTSLGFDIRITEDVGAGVKAQIVLGWDNLLQKVDLKALPRAHRLAVVDEAEHWVRTIAALDSGALKAYRFYALAGNPPGKKK